jgi:enoyl-CoA hydratase/carnithine racemase
LYRLKDYQDRFSNIALERTDSGILTMRLHRDGGPIKWTAIEGGAHDQIGSCLSCIARDPDNNVVILTGTGDVFMVDRVVEEYPPHDAENQYRLIREGQDLISGFIELDLPLITIANGPATYRSEMPMMGDVVLAADDAYFQDSHMRRGLSPSDGCHTVWLEVLGTSRGRYYLMTSEVLTAQQLHAMGAVHEVLPRDQLLPRAMEIAERWVQWSPQTLRYAHITLTHRWRQRALDEVGHGHAFEILGMYSDHERGISRLAGSVDPGSEASH